MINKYAKERYLIISNLEKQMKLAEEAVELIKEFRKEAEILVSNPLNKITIKENGRIIEVDDEFDGIVEYELNEISSIFRMEMDGWGPCSPGFYEAISLAEDDFKDDFEKYTKEEFKEYVGSIKYTEYRCEAIYERLKEIDEEAEEIM